MFSKYKNRRVGNFASRLEHDVYEWLLLQQRGGTFTEIKTQVSVYLTDARILYKPDFQVFHPDGSTLFVEAKGIRTPSFQIKKRLWQFYGPAPLWVVERSGKAGLKVTEEIIVKQKKVLPSES